MKSGSRFSKTAIRLAVAGGLALALAIALGVWLLRVPSFDTGLIPEPVVLMPSVDEPRGAVFLLSGAKGWGDEEALAAGTLQDKGMIVVGIDTSRYLGSMRMPAGDDCVYLVADIERLNQQVQRDIGNANYLLPTVAGVGSGGALALAIAAQTPAATIAGTLAVDPPARIDLALPLCTPANRRPDGGGAIYDLTPGPLPDPIEVVFTTAAPPDGRSHVADLQRNWPAIQVSQSPAAPLDALVAAVEAGAPPAGAGRGRIAKLPLTVLDAAATKGVMAIVVSGDGGWRDLDKVLAQNLQATGIPTVGIDSLRYFWSEKPADQVASDLSAIMDVYGARWRVGKVLLIGYSFGADVLPAAVGSLDERHRSMVAQLSLLGLGHHARSEISVAGWLGWGGGAGPETLPDLQALDLSIVQCIHGREETDSACPDLAGTAAEVVETAGGHHFDGDYAALAKRIEAMLERRRPTPTQ